MSLTTIGGHRYRAKMLPILLAALLCQPMTVTAQSGHEIGAASALPLRPLQELIRKRRKMHRNGLLYVTIAQARVYGEGTGYRAYCSPQIRAINTSYKTVEDLIIGIRYKTSDNKNTGSTVTRFSWVKAGKEDTHYFYSTIDADHCSGLIGEMEVLLCKYDNGEDCIKDVRTVDYGVVPLKIMEKNKENS